MASATSSIMSGAALIVDNLENEEATSPIFLQDSSDEDDDDNEQNGRVQREYLRRNSSSLLDQAANDYASSSGGAESLLMLSKPPVLLTATSDTEEVYHDEEEDDNGSGENGHKNSSSSSASETTAAESSDSPDSRQRVVVVIEDVPQVPSIPPGNDSQNGDNNKNINTSSSSIVHVGDVEGELFEEDAPISCFCDDHQQQDHVQSGTTNEANVAPTTASDALSAGDKRALCTQGSDGTTTLDAYNSPVSCGSSALSSRKQALEKDDASSGTKDMSTVSHSLSIPSAESSACGSPNEQDPGGHGSETVQLIIQTTSLHLHEEEEENDADDDDDDGSTTSDDSTLLLIRETTSKDWKNASITDLEEQQNDTTDGEDLDSAVETFVSQLETQTETAELGSSVRPAGTPTSVRDFWKVASAYKESSSNSPSRKERDPVLEQAVVTPVSARKLAFFQAGASHNQQEEERDPALEQAMSTPLRARREALLAARSGPEVRSLGTTDAALRAACMTPVHERQASLVSPDNTSPIYRASLFHDEAIKAASVTPVNARRAALTAAETNGPSHAPRRVAPENDEALLAASTTPVNARRARLVKETSTAFQKATTEDAALEAASSTPVNSRRALFAESSGIPLPERDPLTTTVAASPMRPKRTNWKTTPSAEEVKANASLRSPSPLENDVAIQAASSKSVNARRAALADDINNRSSDPTCSLRAELDALKEQSLVTSRRRRRNRRARSDRLFFHLGQDRGGMSDKDFLKLDDFLPHERVMLELKESYEMYDDHHHPGSPSSDSFVDSSSRREVVSLRIWLTSPEDKIFEIVTVEMKEDMTVEEVVEEACALALDPVLSEQRYVSLCNRRHEIVQGTKSVQSLLKPTSKGGKGNKRSSSSCHHTLMAVPFGSTAAVIRAIRRALERTDHVKRWLKNSDPFHESKKKKTRRRI